MSQQDLHSFITPIGRVLVKSHSDSITIGSLVIPPEHNQQKCTVGQIIAIGKSVHNDKEVSIAELNLNVGDYVLYQNWSGMEIYKNNETSYNLLKAADVVAIINDIQAFSKFRGDRS